MEMAPAIQLCVAVSSAGARNPIPDPRAARAALGARVRATGRRCARFSDGGDLVAAYAGLESAAKAPRLTSGFPGQQQHGIAEWQVEPAPGGAHEARFGPENRGQDPVNPAPAGWPYLQRQAGIGVRVMTMHR